MRRDVCAGGVKLDGRKPCSECGAGPDGCCARDYRNHIAFARLIANMLLDGETDGAGEVFHMTDEDAQMTLGNLIAKARELAPETRPTGKPGAALPPSSQASGPVGRTFIADDVGGGP